MNKPEMLMSYTVGEIREEINRNRETLETVGYQMTFGLISFTGEMERPVNMVLTEYIVQQEYLRDAEARNWGLIR